MTFSSFLLHQSKHSVYAALPNPASSASSAVFGAETAPRYYESDSMSAMPAHNQTWANVNAPVDEGVRDIVAALSEFLK